MGMYSSLEGTANIEDVNGLPNVGQYGWTAYEIENYKQLIDYVNEAKSYADSVKTDKDYIDSLLTVINAIKNEIDDVFNDIKNQSGVIKNLHDTINGWYSQISIWKDEITSAKVEIAGNLETIRQIFNQINILHDDVITMKNAIAISEANAKTSETNAKTSETNSQDYYNKCYEMYLELKQGQVYRGIWNPNDNVYPNPEGMNSYWDVILNTGQDEVLFDGKRWFFGDRLLYALIDNRYYQSQSGATTVKSVNGKNGAVVLTADDVGAFSSTTVKTLGENDIPWNSKTGIYNASSGGHTRLVAHFYQGVGSSTPSLQIKAMYDNRGLWYRTARDAVGFENSFTKIYTERDKPTPADIGAVNKSGDTITGTLIVDTINNSAGGRLIRYTGSNSTIVGNGTAPTYIDTKDSVLKIRNNDGFESTVYHTSNKPTYVDVGAAPSGFGLGTLSSSELNKIAQEQNQAGWWRDVTIGTAGITMPYDGTPSQAFIGVEMQSGKFKYGVRSGPTTNPINWRYVYSENNKPTAADVGAVSKSGDTINGQLKVNTPNTAYGIEMMSSETALSKKYLRKFRSSAQDTIWHETVQGSTYRIAAGSTDSVDVMTIDTKGQMNLAGQRVYTTGYKPTPADINAADVEIGASDIKILPSINAGRTKEVKIYSKDNNLYTISQDGTVAKFYNDRSYRPTASDFGGLFVENGNEVNFPLEANKTALYFNYRQKGASSVSEIIFSNGKSQLDGRANIYANEYFAAGNKKVYHEGFKPTASDVGALSIGGGTVTGNLTVQTNASQSFTVSGTTYPGINIVSRDLTDARNKILEVNAEGQLNIITRNEANQNNGVITVPKGVNGTIYTTGNKPTPMDLGALPLTGGTMSGIVSSSRKVAQFRGPQNGATPLNDLYSTESGCWSYTSNISRGVTNEFPGVNNANAVLTFNTHTGDYGHQLGFSSDGNLYHRYWKDASWKRLVRGETDGALNVNSLGVTGGAAVGSLHVSGVTTVNGTITSPEAADYMRCTYGGQYGLIHRHDGISYYMLLTNKDDPNGTWNSFRPFRLDLASGRIEMQRGVTASQLTVGGNITGSGGIVLDNTNNATYGMTKWSNDTNAGAKSYLRGWRNYNAGTKWHETVDANVYRIATGVSDSNELLSLNGNGEFRINGPVYSSRSGSGVAAQVSARNSSTSAGVSEFRMEVHGNGNINLTTHDGTNWYYPFSFERTSANVHANGNMLIDGEVQTFGAVRFKATGGSTGEVWAKNWGNTAGRSRVIEWADDKGWWYYTQREADDSVRMAINGSLTVNGINQATWHKANSTTLAFEGKGVISNGANNALIGGAIDGGSWTDWKTRASGLHVDVSDSANKAYNVWKAVHPGKYTFASMQVHCPGSTVDASIVKLYSGDRQFEFKGTGEFVADKITARGDTNVNGYMIVNGSELIINKNGRRHISFSNGAGQKDFYIFKDVGGDGVHLNNGAAGPSEFIFKNVGDFYGPRNADFNDVHIRSDIRLKSDLKEIKNSLNKVNQLTGYTYDKKKSLTEDEIIGREAGLVAQDLKSVLPEAVNEADDSTLTISSAAVNALLVEAIKELTARVESLEKKIGG